MNLLLSILLFCSYTQGTSLLVPPFKHTLGFYRTSKLYMNLYLGDDFELSDPQGITGAKMDEENDFTTTNDEHILTLFAVNSGDGQIIYNVKLSDLKVFGKLGSGPGEFRSPAGITANSKGEVYVADAGNNRIVKLRYAKTKLCFDRIIVDSLGSPKGVALDSKRNLYVADTKNSRIIVFDSTGAFKYSWHDSLNQPTAISIIDKDDDYNYYLDDYLIVIDNENKRIQKFSREGKFFARIDARMIGLTETYFAYSTIDYHGNVYITDMINNQIHKFDHSLNYIISIGRQGDGELEFQQPRGIFISKRLGQVFTTDVSGAQYYLIGTDGYIIGTFPSLITNDTTGTTIALYLTELSQVKIEISDSTKTIIRTIIPSGYSEPGQVLINWDGKDKTGNFVTSGQYTIHTYLYPTYSAPKSYFKKELETKVRKT